MSELYRLLKRRTASAGSISPAAVAYERAYPKYNRHPIAPVLSDCEVGIEIEIERVGPNDVGVYEVWEPKQDGSLRDNGLEYVSLPISGNRISYALHQFFGEISGGYRFSPRTSIHIHQNALNMTLPQIAGELITYGAIEKLLYQFVGGDRDKNNFAVPYYETSIYDHINIFLRGSLADIMGYENHRYLGLNIASVTKLGTLEFRHLGGTDNIEKILKWINLIFCLKKFAMAHSYEEIKSRIDRLNTNSEYDIFVQDVFGECASSLNRFNLKKDMEHSVSLIKKIRTEHNKLHLKATKNIPESHWYQILTTPKKPAPTMTYTFSKPPPPPRAPRQPRGLRPIEPRREELRINNADLIQRLAEQQRAFDRGILGDGAVVGVYAQPNIVDPAQANAYEDALIDIRFEDEDEE